MFSNQSGFASIPAGKNPCQCNRKVQHQVGWHVVMRLAAADRANSAHGDIGRGIIGVVAVGPNVVDGHTLIGRIGARHRAVRVLGNFVRIQGMIYFAPHLTQIVAGARMNRRGPLKVGQAKVLDAIAAVSCSQNGEKRLILVDRQKLPVGQRPAFGRKIESEEGDLA